MQNIQKYRRMKNLFFKTELSGCLGGLWEKYPKVQLCTMGLCSIDGIQ